MRSILYFLCKENCYSQGLQTYSPQLPLVLKGESFLHNRNISMGILAIYCYLGVKNNKKNASEYLSLPLVLQEYNLCMTRREGKMFLSYYNVMQCIMYKSPKQSVITFCYATMFLLSLWFIGFITKDWYSWLVHSQWSVQEVPRSIPM